jgi:hypothetical protein
LTVENSTVAANTARNGGGGIAGAAGTVKLHSSTIWNNVADSDNDGFGTGGGILALNSAVSAQNTLIADNGNCCAIFSIPEPEDCSGTISSSLGYNLVEYVQICTLIGNVTGVITNTDPMAGALGENGGPTQTLSLASGSPAIDGGNPAGCVDGDGIDIVNDQRGYLRHFDGDGNGSAICDIGAFEYGAPEPSPSPTPTPTPSPTPTATATPTASASATPTPTASPASSATPTGSAGQELMQGDVDCDEDVDSVDALKGLRHVAHLSVQQDEPCPDIETEVASKFGDVDCDNDVDAVDALKVLRYVASLPVQQNGDCTDIGEPL